MCLTGETSGDAVDADEQNLRAEEVNANLGW